VRLCDQVSVETMSDGDREMLKLRTIAAVTDQLEHGLEVMWVSQCVSILVHMGKHLPNGSTHWFCTQLVADR